ncbi:MAG: abortive infection family protein [Victivallales bacterium]
MRTQIPSFVIAVLSDVISQAETHATLNALFMYADAPGDAPEGNKQFKVQEWLRRVNKTESVDPFRVLGKILEKYLDDESASDFDPSSDFKRTRNKKIRDVLQRANIRYAGGGLISGVDSNQILSLEEEIKKLNVQAVDYEFKRAIKNVDSDPYEAVSAACNILESIFKVILEDLNIEKPKVQDLSGLWKVVKKELGLDADQLEDQDFLQILSGLSAVISGVAALRTHTSSAHGRGNFRYTLRSRHVLLAIHAAHTLALFILQTKKDRAQQGNF